MKKYYKSLFIGCFLAVFFLLSYCFSQEDNTTELPEEREATVFSVTGDAKVVPMGSSIGVQCKQGMTIKEGDWIKTGPGGFVTLAFDDKAENVIKVQENSLVIMKMDGYFKIQLLEGKMNAILENVEKGEVFRALTPSVVTEATNSGWVVSSEGNYTTVVVADGEAYVCGLNKDGSVKKDKFKIEEGFGRTTKLYENPGEMVKTPESVLQWFQDQVVEHHLDKVISKKAAEQKTETPDVKKTEEDQKKQTVKSFSTTAALKGKNVAIIDGQEVDLLEYLYKTRLAKDEENTE
ncbi:MAG: FecR domain-containing protein [Candidatus Omnitrophica bacterium]|nr:FecR domain-containing protein [Candidatus Omnitrophota bacterium]